MNAWLGAELRHILIRIGHFKRMVVEVVAEDADYLAIDDMRCH